jgi:hypothetical protein
MKAGDLVRITRATIGCPKGSLALVETKLKDIGRPNHFGPSDLAIWQVYLVRVLQNSLENSAVV